MKSESKSRGSRHITRRKFLHSSALLPTLASMGTAAKIPLARSSPRAAAESSQFELQVVVDVYDDFLNNRFSAKSFQEMMRIFRSWSVTRVYWVGQSFASGLYDAESTARLDLNALLTFKEVGEFIPAAAQHAHAEGMEFYVEFKPFDQYFPLLVPVVPPGWTPLLLPETMTLFKAINCWRKGIPALGGAWQMGTLFPEQHPEYLIARNMTGVRKGIEKEAIGTIKFVKNDDRPTGINKGNLQIYVSDDNLKYRKYQGTYDYQDRIEKRPGVVKGVNLNRTGTKMESVRVLTLTGLNIKQPYLAVSTQAKEGEPDFANNYYQLVELYTPNGEPMPFTYGIPRAQSDLWYPPALYDKRFPERGFMFGFSGNLSNEFNYSLIDVVGHLDSEQKHWVIDSSDPEGYRDSERGLLGLAKGKNAYMSVLCPAFPEVRDYWLSQVQEFIDSGVDGVEFRWASHQDAIDLDAYGFNAPVVEEYKKRYGVNILTEDFDKAKWRKLRGEYYTRFLRDAKALLNQHGKKMQVDVMPSNNSDPAAPQFLNIHLDWEQWFSFADAATFKWQHLIPPAQAAQGRFGSSKFKQVAEKFGIPTYYSFWPERVFKGMSKQQIVEGIGQIKAAGHKGLVLYEAAALMNAKCDGTFDITYPQVSDIIAPAVRAMNEATRS